MTPVYMFLNEHTSTCYLESCDMPEIRKQETRKISNNRSGNTSVLYHIYHYLYKSHGYEQGSSCKTPEIFKVLQFPFIIISYENVILL
jgi:hypothetical protein